jgi:hypothetical protein
LWISGPAREFSSLNKPTQEKHIKYEIKTFQDKHKLKQFIIAKLAIQKILKGILHTKEEEQQSQRQEFRKGQIS